MQVLNGSSFPSVIRACQDHGKQYLLATLFDAPVTIDVSALLHRFFTHKEQLTID